MEMKRVFLGNLPPNITEDGITEKFSGFGKVVSVDVKQRQDGSTFAFLNLHINSRDLQFCFRDVPKTWDGYQVKLELAKESFLNRLEKERQQAKSQSVLVDTDKQIHPQNMRKSVAFKRDSNIHTTETIKNNNFLNHTIVVAPSSGEAEFQLNRKLPMFKGINNSICDSKSNVTELQELTVDKILPYTTKYVDKNHYESEDLHLLDNSKMFSELKEGKKIQSEKGKKNETTSECFVKNSKNEVENNTKNVIADKKRLKSIEERKNVVLHQKEIVKLALASLDSNGKHNNKIKFEMDEEESILNNSDSGIKKAKGRRDVSKPSLFNADESEDEEEDQFRIKSQFEGKKGQKLLELQTRYGTDKRFTLDERFYESDGNSKDGNEVTSEVYSRDSEKERQLGILQDILGHDVHLPKDNEPKKKTKSMLRYDPTKPGHIKYEVTQQMDTVSAKKKEDRSSKKSADHSASKSSNVAKPVSKEKFYMVTDHLKETLQKKDETAVFSLLDMFGPSNDGDRDDQENDSGKYASKNTITSKTAFGWTSNPFKYDSSESEEEKEDEKSVKPITNPVPPSQHGVWQESFFFKPDDARLQEGITFFTKIDVGKDHNFSERRRELKKIIKSKIKNNQTRKKTWKKKYGGQKSNKHFRKVR